MENQRRRLDRRQNVADVDLEIGPHQRKNGPRARRGPLQLAEPLDESLIVSSAWSVDRDENALTPALVYLAKELVPLLRLHGPRLSLDAGEAAAQDEG